MKRWLKTVFFFVATRLWLRPGTHRRSVIGPYRGLTFSLSPLMMNRLDVFYRSYEANVTHWLTDSVQPGMTVYVVGAHIGLHVLYIIKRLQDSGRLAAFEGWPENFGFLQENLALNAVPGITVTAVPKCVAETSSVVRMAAGSSDGKHHLTDRDEGRTIEVPSTSLDDFYAEHPACPALILMDIEGYELDALKGAAHLLQACKPKLALEHHGKAEALRDWLTQHGYTVTVIDKRHIFAQ